MAKNRHFCFTADTLLISKYTLSVVKSCNLIYCTQFLEYFVAYMSLYNIEDSFNEKYEILLNGGAFHCLAYLFKNM